MYIQNFNVFLTIIMPSAFINKVGQLLFVIAMISEISNFSNVYGETTLTNIYCSSLILSSSHEIQ